MVNSWFPYHERPDAVFEVAIGPRQTRVLPQMLRP
jgi:hypothetical protein